MAFPQCYDTTIVYHLFYRDHLWKYDCRAGRLDAYQTGCDPRFVGTCSVRGFGFYDIGLGCADSFSDPCADLPSNLCYQIRAHPIWHRVFDLTSAAPVLRPAQASLGALLVVNIFIEDEIREIKKSFDH